MSCTAVVVADDDVVVVAGGEVDVGVHVRGLRTSTGSSSEKKLRPGPEAIVHLQ